MWKNSSHPDKVSAQVQSTQRRQRGNLRRHAIEHQVIQCQLGQRAQRGQPLQHNAGGIIEFDIETLDHNRGMIRLHATSLTNFKLYHLMPISQGLGSAT